MKRNALDYLIEWNSRKNRKPVIIRGARQVGKSFLVRMFAEEVSYDLVEINFEYNPELTDLFKSNDPNQIIQLLELKLNTKITSEKTLLFLDEIQAAPSVLAALRYFYEQMPELHVIAAGSLLEFVLEDHSFSMPVGRIEYLHLGPMSFEEFLVAAGRNNLFEFLHTYSLQSDFPNIIHKELLDLFKRYLVIGGMPEVIKTYLETDSTRNCEMAKQSLLSTYRDDFSKYGKRVNHQRLQKVFNSIPAIVGNKLKYVTISRNEKPSSIESALHMLELARVIYRVCHSSSNGIPLGAQVNRKHNKPLFLDVGLQCRTLGLNLLDFENPDTIMMINSGAICEQFIGQHLLYSNEFFIEPELYYWVREKSQSSAEVDYVLSEGQRIIPVEVKAGKTGTLKSMQVFLQEKNIDLAVRFNTDIPSVTHTRTAIPGKPQPFTLLSLPLYMVGQIKRLLKSELT